MKEAIWKIGIYIGAAYVAFLGSLSVLMGIRDLLDGKFFGVAFILVSFYIFKWLWDQSKKKDDLIDYQYFQSQIAVFRDNKIKTLSIFIGVIGYLIIRYGNIIFPNQLLFMAIHFPSMFSETMIFSVSVFLKFSLGLGFLIPALSIVSPIAQVFYFYKVSDFVLGIIYRKVKKN